MDDNMNPSRAGSRIVWVILVLALIAAAVAAAVYFGAGKKPASNENEQAANAEHEITVKEIPQTQAPDFFPASMPAEAGAVILKNFNTTSVDGRKMGTRIYVTKKSADENYKLFEGYFKKDGWDTSEAPPFPNSKNRTLIALKGDMQAQVTLGEDAVAKAQTVTIVLTQKP